ncbi:MAG: FG-GAP repeat domain-containing protein, partial [Candidatus Hydrothermia bacterium]
GNFEYPDTTQVYSLILWDWPWNGEIDSLASWCTEASVSADLNSDGYEDLVMAVFRDSIRGLDSTKSVIYWGGPLGFSEANKTLLPTLGCHGTTVADLNRDGYLDIVFANTYASWGYDSVDSYIYWGGPGGYSVRSRKSLDTHGAYGVTVGDLNKDGYLDLVFPQREAEKSAIFYGSPMGFSYYPNLKIYSRGATAAWLEDLDKDGLLDLILARKITNEHPQTIIYWNRGGSFSESDTTYLESPGGYGLFSEDYDRDGWPDILILNKENTATDQNTYAQVYYNLGRRPYFSGSCRLDTFPIYAAGRGRTMDFWGNIYDRKPRHILILPTIEATKWVALDSFRVFGQTRGASFRARYQCRGPNGSVWLSPGSDSAALGLRVALEITFVPGFASVFQIDSVYLFWHKCPEHFTVKRLLWTSLPGDSLYFWNPGESARIDIYNIVGQRTQNMNIGEPGHGALAVDGPVGIYIARFLIDEREIYRLKWRKVR